MSIGPAAASALVALEARLERKDDPYVHEQVASAAKFIRQSLLVTPLGQVAERGRLMDVREQLNSPDPFVRATGAERAASTADAAAVAPARERLLSDEEFVEVGVEGRFECDDRLFHWRQERWSPRASAIRALFALGRIPPGDSMLKAMLATSMNARVICGRSAAPHRFAIGQWKEAVAAAGGHAVADARIRAARQQCRAQPWSGNNAPYICATELEEVVRQLSGRIIPGS
jgi:hypothetical protein